MDMKIKPIFTTTVSKDVFNRDGSLYVKKGSLVAYSTSFVTKKFGEFTLMTPNPVHLFLQNAEFLVSKMVGVEHEINSSDKIYVFSKYVDGVNSFTTDELLSIDPDAKQIRSINSDVLYKYLYLGSSVLVTLISAVEAFVNQEIPNDYEISLQRQDGDTVLLSKVEIERKLSIEDKITHVARVLGKSDYKKQRFWSAFKKVKRLRDDLVHVKTRGSEMVNRHDDLFTELFNLNFEESQNQIICMINYFKNNYVEK